MSLPALDLVLHPETPVKRDVRRFRWFRRAFVEQVASVSRACGIGFEVRTERLAEAFVDWSRAFAAQKPDGEADKRAFVDFASGLMLYHLLRTMPVTAGVPDNRAPDAAPVAFWPAGFACLAFCLNVRKAVLAQNFGETSEPAPEIDDLRSWWSFRENVAESGARAVPFFSLFAGAEPDWESGLEFRAAPVARPAAVRLRVVQDNPRPQPAARATSTAWTAR